MKQNLRVTIATLLAHGASQHEIARRTGVDRKTVRRYAATSNSPMATGSASAAEQIPPPWPPASADADLRAPAQASSACAPHRAWIETQVALGRNAVAIYQDLVEQHGFVHRYNSVKRFVRALRQRDPERFDVLESAPGEEAQVDFGQGALTLSDNGKFRRPYLFVMTLKYSGKSFRKVVWKADQEAWARLHEEAFRSFGGSVAYVVLDNLKQGVIRPDLYAPELNPVYAAMLAHYGAIADPARVRDPDRKGTVENAIQHTQSTALKGKRFDTIDAQNVHLAHWEERWAAPRIHGRKKRQVLAMYAEEQPHLKRLPSEGFRFFKQEVRTVDDSGLVQVQGAYYSALPAAVHTRVTVRIYATEVEILDDHGQVLRRHAKATRKGQFVLPDEDRLFNPSRETARVMARAARIGPISERLATEIFARLGRPGQRAIYGLSQLARHYTCADIEAASTAVLALPLPSYQALKRILERSAGARTERAPLAQSGAAIRSIDEYQQFFTNHAASETTH